MEAFATLAKDNADIVEIKPSKYEQYTDAMWVREDCPTFEFEGKGVRRELSHIHGTGDYSAHVVLSPKDCKKVIDSGWGQLHLLAGSSVVKSLIGTKLPVTYTLLYAPRNEEELKNLIEIIKASMGYMTGSKNVK